MKIVFFGTPDYVLPILSNLQKTFNVSLDTGIVAVVTSKPKPTGRNKFINFSAVDTWAHKRKIPVFYNPEEIVEGSINAELGVVASYGSIIPKDVINHFKYGIINVHPSLLPIYRGSSPVQATIIDGLETTGVSIIKLDEKLDHGPILTQYKEEVLPADTTLTLRARLFERSCALLDELIPAYTKGKIKLKPQDENMVILTREAKAQDGFIPVGILKEILDGSGITKEITLPFLDNRVYLATPVFLERFVRAMDPWPHVWSLVKTKKDGLDKRFKIFSSHLEGTKLILDEVQLEGKGKVTFKQLKEGYPELNL